MSFEIFYAGEVSTQQIFYSDPKNYISPLDKYDKFIQKMDALAKEIKQLETEEENYLPIEEKQEEMVALVQKEFTQKSLGECCESGVENYFIHDSAGRLEVDDKKISIKDFFGNDYEKWEKERDERLGKLDWYLIYDVLDGGVHTTGEGLEIEEGEFDKKKLTMKDNCLHYDDEPIISPDGTDREGATLELYVGGVCVSEVEPVWEEEEEEEEEKEEKEDLSGKERRRRTREKKVEFEFATMKGNSLFFDKGDAADVETYESLKDLSNGYFIGGECEALGLEYFTPGFGECKEITDIKDFLHKCAKEEGLSEVFLHVEWQRDSEWSIDPDTLELGNLIEGSPIDNSYFHWKEGKLEEIYDLLELGEDE